ncbi:MAG: type II secretion system protein [Candidatus Shapirobacteria bacterium]|jgi:prepilin-type N-terminal cleavage/methylation domain-containing protein
MKKNKKAFTFIELIVVITIIAVLSVAGVISYSSANKKSRDARRISDLEKMRMALEMVRQTGTTYPDNNSYVNVLSPNYLQTIPVDPKSGRYQDYYYNIGSNGYTYSIQVSMESVGYTCLTCTPGFSYKVTNP